MVATNALELGIDIGRLQAAILCGYPGSIASTWQQIGRAGRTTEAALAILVATGGALDQYVIRHPEFIFEQSPEHALINPDNLMLLVDQMRCAAFELPFASGETFGQTPYVDAVLQLLTEHGDLYQADHDYFWAGTAYPASAVSLRSTGSDPVAIQSRAAHSTVSGSQETGQVTIIGEVDQAGAVLLVHDGAVYLHEGQSYLVDNLDLQTDLARVTPVDVDYYTDAIAQTNVEILAEHERSTHPGTLAAHGELRVSTQVAGYRRIKRFTHETLGIFPLDYPPQEIETSGYWFNIVPVAQAMLEQAGQWYDSVNDYGPNWEEQRLRVRARDGYHCTQCGVREPAGRQHDVHHLVPFRTFGYVRGLNERYKEANRLSNLILVCRTCHQRLEAVVRVRSGLDGLAYALHNLAPLYLMCDRQDIGVHVVRAAASRSSVSGPAAQADTSGAGDAVAAQLPTVYLYEQVAAGLGFSARLFDLHDTLLRAAAGLIANCPCSTGCPACVGPVPETAEASLDTKQLALAILQVLTTGPTAQRQRQAEPAGDVDFGM